MNDTIEKLKQITRDSWSGRIGEERAEDLENYLMHKLKEYSGTLKVSKEKILESWESKRKYSPVNYYQECNQPSLKSKNTKIFESKEAMLDKIGKKEFRCPSCGCISTNPYECSECDWKVYGLFGDLGKGIYIFCKDEMIGETIFMPIDWEVDYESEVTQ